MVHFLCFLYKEPLSNQLFDDEIQPMNKRPLKKYVIQGRGKFRKKVTKWSAEMEGNGLRQKKKICAT